MDERLGEGLWGALVVVGERLAAVVPALLILLVLLGLGLLLGWLARSLITRLARAVGVDDHLEHWGVGASIRRSGILRAPSDVLGLVAFWGIFVLFASVGVDSLALPGAPGATAFLAGFLPPLLAAILIVIVGWLVANFLSQAILIAAVNARVPEARLLARAAHWAVLLFAIATALTHLGIGKEMVLVAFGITFGGLVLALSLAFGLGGRGLAREILMRRLRRESPPPQEHLTHL
jgi:hypothetical protein